MTLSAKKATSPELLAEVCFRLCGGRHGTVSVLAYAINRCTSADSLE